MGLFTINNINNSEPTTSDKLKELLIEYVAKDETLDAQYVIDELPVLERYHTGGDEFGSYSHAKIKLDIQEEIDMRRKINKLKEQMKSSEERK